MAGENLVKSLGICITFRNFLFELCVDARCNISLNPMGSLYNQTI